MWKYVIANAKRSSRQHLAVTLAVAISTAFLTVVLLAQATIVHNLRDSAAQGTEHYDLMLQINDQSAAPTLVNNIRSTAGIEAVTVNSTGMLWFTHSFQPIQMVNQRSDATLAQGRWPTRPGEVAWTAQVAEKLTTKIGDTISVATEPPGSGASNSSALPLTMVGIIEDPGFAAPRGVPLGVLDSDEFTGYDWATALDTVWVAGSAEALTTTGAIITQPGANGDPIATAMTTTEYVDTISKADEDGLAMITAALMGFVAAAALASALVVHNTFSVLIARRRTTISLLRLLGATRKQTQHSVLGEAVLIGGCGAAAGTAIGLLIAALGVQSVPDFAGLSFSNLTVTWDVLVVPPVVGTLTTVAAAVVSARTAAKLPPLAAAASAESNALHRWPIVVGALFMLAGLAGTIAAVVAGRSDWGPMLALSLAVTATAFSLIATVMLLPVLVRTVAGAMRHHLPGTAAATRLTTRLVHNAPQRPAAVAAALVVGLGLVVAVDTGTANIKAGIQEAITAQSTVDVTVHGPVGSSLPADTVDQVAAVNAVAATAQQFTIDVSSDAIAEPLIGAVAYSSTIDDVVRKKAEEYSCATSTAKVSSWAAKKWGLHQGQLITLTANREELTVQVEITTQTSPTSPPLLLNYQDLQQLGQPMLSAVLVRATEGANTIELADDVSVVAKSVPGSFVTSVAYSQVRIQSVMKGLLWFALAMTIAALLVALIGVGNTVALSTVENSRRIALTRALGFTAKQAKAGVLAESFLMAGIGTVLAIMLGTFFGWAAAQAVLGKYASSLPQMNAVTVLALAALMVAATLTAAYLPARYASRLPPTAALTQLPR